MKRALLILLLVVLVLVLILKTRRSGYAPPRDENTVLPFVEPSKDYPAADNQSNVFMDAGGWANMREHPMAPFLQARITSDVGSYGEFVGLESSSGDAPMFVIAADEQYVYERSAPFKDVEYIPNITSPAIPPMYNPACPEEAMVAFTDIAEDYKIPTIVSTGQQECRDKSTPVGRSCVQCPVDYEVETSDMGYTGYIQIDANKYATCSNKSTRTVGPGIYELKDKRMYRMKVWPPLQIEAKGPNGEYLKSEYKKTGTGCPSPSFLVLEKEKNYTQLVISPAETLTLQPGQSAKEIDYNRFDQERLLLLQNRLTGAEQPAS